MKETISSYIVQYSTILNGQYGRLGDYIDYPNDLSHIKKEFDSVLYDKIMRSFMSQKKKEERDRKIHIS